MSKPWHPKNWEEACKRNAGRKKLHQRKRKERADRIVRLPVLVAELPPKQAAMEIAKLAAFVSYSLSPK